MCVYTHKTCSNILFDKMYFSDFNVIIGRENIFAFAFFKGINKNKKKIRKKKYQYDRENTEMIIIGPDDTIFSGCILFSMKYKNTFTSKSLKYLFFVFRLIML